MTQQPAPEADEPHVCKPGATVYYCPTANDTEADCHGGFDVCCAQPDLHQQVLKCSLAHCGQVHPPHSWEPQPGMKPVHCEGFGVHRNEPMEERQAAQQIRTSAPEAPPVMTEVEELRDKLASFEYAWQRIREVFPTEAPADIELVEARALAARWEEKYFELVEKYTPAAVQAAALREWVPVLRRAVESLPATCMYHDETHPHGSWREACCDTGIPARRRALAEKALAALTAEGAK